jgi:hypothetical protein
MTSDKFRKAVEKLVWKKTHKDYRSTTGGIKKILILDRNTGATTLAPLSSISTERLLEKLGDAIKEIKQP